MSSTWTLRLSHRIALRVAPRIRRPDHRCRRWKTPRVASGRDCPARTGCNRRIATAIRCRETDPARRPSRCAGPWRRRRSLVCHCLPPPPFSVPDPRETIHSRCYGYRQVRIGVNLFQQYLCVHGRPRRNAICRPRIVSEGGPRGSRCRRPAGCRCRAPAPAGSGSVSAVRLTDATDAEGAWWGNRRFSPSWSRSPWW